MEYSYHWKQKMGFWIIITKWLFSIWKKHQNVQLLFLYKMGNHLCILLFARLFDSNFVLHNKKKIKIKISSHYIAMIEWTIVCCYSVEIFQNDCKRCLIKWQWIIHLCICFYHSKIHCSFSIAVAKRKENGVFCVFVCVWRLWFEMRIKKPVKMNVLESYLILKFEYRLDFHSFSYASNV